jgi:UDP-N-acetylmuramate-alanine ligase
VAQENVLFNKWVLAVAGTHGKTTTSSMLAWILESSGHAPGFLIGGIPADFSISARLTPSSLFVIEGDEYDTAFFDKRSKFVHYRPKTAVLNNIEFDHADIFANLAEIERQISAFDPDHSPFRTDRQQWSGPGCEASADSRLLDAGRGIRQCDRLDCEFARSGRSFRRSLAG